MTTAAALEQARALTFTRSMLPDQQRKIAAALMHAWADGWDAGDRLLEA